MRGRLQTTNPYTDVWMEKVHVAGEEVQKMAIQIKDDEGKPQLVEIHSPEYRLVKNSVIRDVMDDIKSRSDYNWKNLSTYWDGKKFVDFSITEERITVINNGGEHEIFLGMMTRNSYDGSCQFELGFFGFNTRCTNKYHSRNLFGSYSMRHMESVEAWDTQDALGNISKASVALLDVAPKIESLRSHKLTAEYILEARKKTRICSSRWGLVLEKMYEEEPSRFGFFQAMTDVISHDMTGINAIEVGNSITDFCLENN